jgi:chloramphenicol-sensitive protein RarD
VTPVRRGVLLGIACYFAWGLFPLYWPLLEPAGAGEILAHRIVWSLVLMAVVVTVARQWSGLRALGARTWLLVIAASLFIAVNWGVYIYAVNSGHVIDAALGYFVNPLLSVVLGVVVFRERLGRVQWTAVGLGFVAVLVISIAGGHFPWIAILLATSFGLYGLVKKVVPLPPTASLTAEGMVLFLPAVGYLTYLQVHGTGTLSGHGTGRVALLVASGVVTVVPLLAFAGAARSLPLSVLGLLQYLTPVVQFLIGVLWQHEHMIAARWIGFVLVWIALILLSAHGLRQARRAAREPAQVGGSEPVDGLADEVGVAVVSCVLLDEVAQDPPEAGRTAVRPRAHRRLIRATCSQRLGDTLPRPVDRRLPECVQMVRGVLRCGVPLPVPVRSPVDGIPRVTRRLPQQAGREPVHLDVGQVLEHAAERHRRHSDRGLQTGGVQTAGFPGEGLALVVEKSQQRAHLVGGGRRFGTALFVDVGHDHEV